LGWVDKGWEARGFTKADRAGEEDDCPETDLDFAHFFRLAVWGDKNKVKAERSVEQGKIGPFFPEAAGGLEAHPEGEGSLFDIVNGLLGMACLSEEGERWWEEPLFVYRLRRFFRSDAEIFPTEEDLGLDRESPYVLPYCERMWFTFGLEGGAFVAFDAPKAGFFGETLPKYVAESYRLLFNVAVHQWLTLMRLSKEVAEHWLLGSEEEGEETFSRIRDAFLEFTARGFFVQATQTTPRQRFLREVARRHSTSKGFTGRWPKRSGRCTTTS